MPDVRRSGDPEGCAPMVPWQFAKAQLRSKIFVCRAESFTSAGQLSSQLSFLSPHEATSGSARRTAVLAQSPRRMAACVPQVGRSRRPAFLLSRAAVDAGPGVEAL